MDIALRDSKEAKEKEFMRRDDELHLFLDHQYAERHQPELSFNEGEGKPRTRKNHLED